MKKYFTIVFLFILVHFNGFGQNARLKRLAEATHDTNRVLIMTEISSGFKFNRPDSAIYYANKALLLARQIKYTKGEQEALFYISVSNATLGNETKALRNSLEGLKIAEQNKSAYYKARFLMNLGTIYHSSGKHEQALKYMRESSQLFYSIGDINFYCITQLFVSRFFLKMNQPDSALYYCTLIYYNHEKAKWVDYYTFYRLGEIQNQMGNTEVALTYFRKTLGMTKQKDYLFDSNLSIAKIFQHYNNIDSSIYYAEKSLLLARESNIYSNIIEANLYLTDLYESIDFQKALKYSKNAIAYNDSLNSLVKSSSFLTFTDFDEQERKREIEEAKTEFRNRLRLNAFLGSTFTLLVIAIFLFILSRRKQKAKKKIEEAFERLKSTQAQLIQSEKMASLGELTAGIAHEIQNPLNFVNNFSEVSNELLHEMKDELVTGNLQLATDIADDVIQNLEKIHHHGERASSIVKGMLQHSRTSTGQKELTDINALADEYLRLSYHGLRAKDNSFNADFKLETDENLPKINVIPQDIGRVLLNLINNAFYAAPLPPEGGFKDLDTHKPLVTVSTSFIPPSGGMRGAVCVSVIDNGPGINKNIVDKIFQPFFTTKPTGQGTGLGLSLSYDIIKAHGGELKVKSKEGEGSVFIIEIPLKS